MRRLALLALALTGCALAVARSDSVVPATIGVVVTREPAGVTVVALRGASELRTGDVVLRYNGVPITDARQFYRLVLDTPPGSVARLDIRRQGAERVIEVPVEELETARRI